MHHKNEINETAYEKTLGRLECQITIDYIKSKQKEHEKKKTWLFKNICIAGVIAFILSALLRHETTQILKDFIVTQDVVQTSDVAQNLSTFSLIGLCVFPVFIIIGASLYFIQKRKNIKEYLMYYPNEIILIEEYLKDMIKIPCEVHKIRMTLVERRNEINRLIEHRESFVEYKLEILDKLARLAGVVGTFVFMFFFTTYITSGIIDTETPVLIQSISSFSLEMFLGSALFASSTFGFYNFKKNSAEKKYMILNEKKADLLENFKNGNK